MYWIALGAFVLLAITWLWIARIRRSGITGQKKRDKHFRHLAGELGFQFVTDDYFVQLEGSRNDFRVIVYPHNFEGPGLITLIYLETNAPSKDQNWIEPNLSLGRALVDWKRQAPHDYEVTGTNLSKNVLDAIQKFNHDYPYLAVTLPWRFGYSPLLQKTFLTWKNYAVLIAMDSGRNPSKEQIEQGINDAVAIATVVQSETFSDTTE